METTKEKKTFSWHVMKRRIFFAILVLYAVIALANHSAYLRPKSLETAPEKYPDQQYLQLGEDDVIIQEFTATEPRWAGVSFFFKNPNFTTAQGYITVELYTKDDELLGYSSLAANTLKHTKRRNFAIEATVEKGETYYYKIICQDLYNDHGIFIRLLPKEHEVLGDTIVNGAKQQLPLDCKLKFYRYDLKIIIVTVILWLFILWIVVLPESFWEKLKQSGRNDEYNRLFFTLSPFLSFWIVERFSNVPITKIMDNPQYFGLNLLVYVTLLLIFYLITNRTKASSLLLLLSTFILGCVSYYVNIFRGAQLYPSDFLSIGTALNVANNYQITITLMVLNNILLLLAFCVPMCMLENKKGVNIKQRIGILVAVLLCLVTVNHVYLDGDYLKENNIKVSSFKPRKGYKKYGFAMSFMIQVYYLIPDKPDNYSVDAVEEIIADYASDPVDMETDVKPNIICIMSETLADLDYINEVETSEEVLPFINSLEENTIKGKLHMSIFGSNTANSEFEFLTGNSMAFLPGRTVVYEFFVQSVMPNLTYNLTPQNYTYNKALHPYKRDGWNRENVYNLFGFSEFIDETMFKNQDTVRKFISDEANYKEIIDAFEETRQTSTDPFYLFNVTMQNHGSYGIKSGVIDEPITFANPALQRNEMARQYINLIKITDDATKDLIHYFENVDEPTVIVMFGDHMPTLSEGIYKQLYGKSVDDLTLEETSRMYTTPYFIWANYDIQEETVDMSANYLASYMQRALGLPLTAYNKYLLELQETLPVITQICHIDKDGNIYEAEDEESPYRDLLNEYHTVQYNNVIDYENRVEEFFTLDGFELPDKGKIVGSYGTTATEATTETTTAVSGN